MFIINFLLISLSLFFTTTIQLDCEDITVNPILPVGCDVIYGDIDLAASNYTQQDLQIGYYHRENVHNPNLTTFEGFNALRIINGSFDCWNPVIESFMGLQNLTNVTGHVDIGTTVRLFDLFGFHSLQNIGGNLRIHSTNNRLTSLWGLNSLKNIGGHLYISRNLGLTSIWQLNSVRTIAGFITIAHNGVLRSLSGLHSIRNIGSLTIEGNSVLTSLFGVHSLQNITGDLTIWNNNDLDCRNVCNRKITNHLRNIASGEPNDQCGVSSFICASNPNTIIEQMNGCTYNSQCQVCNETDCKFETMYRGCADGIVDLENGEECDNLINTTNCSYGQQSCQLCNSTICKNFTGDLVFGYCGDNTINFEFGETCDNTSDPKCVNCAIVTKSSSTSSLTSTVEPTSNFDSRINSESSLVTLVSNITDSDSNFESSSDINGFDCGLYSCVISEMEDIKIFTVDQLDLTSNLLILNNQKLIISFGNFTLNGYNLSLSSTSTIQIENGCLDAKHSTLNLDLTDTEITPEKKSLQLIEYECITNEFSKIETTSSSGVCLAVEEVYSANYYSVLISQNSYCVSDSSRYTIYQSFYLVIFVFIIIVV